MVERDQRREHQDSLKVGSLVFRAEGEGLIVETRDARYVLDARHSRQLLQLLRSRQEDGMRPGQEPASGQEPRHRLPLWVYAMHEIC